MSFVFWSGQGLEYRARVGIMPIMNFLAGLLLGVLTTLAALTMIGWRQNREREASRIERENDQQKTLISLVNSLRNVVPKMTTKPEKGN